jgi:hypothetical protein
MLLVTPIEVDFRGLAVAHHLPTSLQRKSARVVSAGTYAHAQPVLLVPNFGVLEACLRLIIIRVRIHLRHASILLLQKRIHLLEHKNTRRCFLGDTLVGF